MEPEQRERLWDVTMQQAELAQKLAGQMSNVVGHERKAIEDALSALMYAGTSNMQLLSQSRPAHCLSPYIWHW